MRRQTVNFELPEWFVNDDFQIVITPLAGAISTKFIYGIEILFDGNPIVIVHDSNITNGMREALERTHSIAQTKSQVT